MTGVGCWQYLVCNEFNYPKSSTRYRKAYTCEDDIIEPLGQKFIHRMRGQVSYICNSNGERGSGSNGNYLRSPYFR